MSTLPRIDVDALVVRIAEARARAIRWIEDGLGADGGPVGDDALLEARIPLACALAGRADLGTRSLAWYRAHPDRRMFDGTGERYGSYYLALLAHGAAQLGRWDAADELCDALTRWHAPCGAPWSRTRSGCGEVEIVPACQAGMTYLAASRRDEGLRIADLVVDAWAQQPAPEDRLYLICDADGQLITEPHRGEADGERAFYVLEREGERQHFFTGGIAAALLVQAHWVTGEARYLACARQYFAFAIAQPHQFGAYQCCKTAWGASYLAAATGEEEPAAWIARMAEWFLAEQRADGSWIDPNFSDAASPVALITSEFAQHLSALTFGLGHLKRA